MPGRLHALFALILLFPQPAFAQNHENIDKAINLIKTLCISTGKKLEIDAKGQAGITLRQLKDNGISGEVHISQQEFEGFSEALQALSEQQATQARECMKPHIGRLLDAILGAQSTSQKQISQADIQVITAKVMKKYASIAQILIRHTHPTGKFSETFKPSIHTNPDSKSVDAMLTISWRGGFSGNKYLTVFAMQITPTGLTDLKVVSDTALIKIAPENLRAATMDVKSIFGENS